MTDDRLDATLGSFYRDTAAPPPDQQRGVAEVMSGVRRTRQRGRHWPLPAFDRTALPTRQLAPAPIPATNGHAPARGFTMLSAVKFMVASVIVALCGGFLMAGVLITQPSDDSFSAAVSASPTIEATNEPTEEETTSVRSDILPGVELTVEEVEPGVFRVLNDGVRTWFSGQILAGHDGSILLFEGGECTPMRRGSFSRLGSDKAFRFPEGCGSSILVAPDGSVWVSGTRRSRGTEVTLIHSFENGKWTRRLKVPSFSAPHALTVGPDGAIWTSHPAKSMKEGVVVTRLGPDGWRRIEKGAPGYRFGELVVTEGGELWQVPQHVGYSFSFDDDGSWQMEEGGVLWRLQTWERGGGGSEWHEVTVDALVHDPTNTGVELGTDGTVWIAGVSPVVVDGQPIRLEDSLIAEPAGSFVMRYDGREWQRWGPDDGVPSLTWSGPQLEQAPDGGLWIVARPGSWGMPVGTDPAPFDGIARFDGSTWQYLLSGHRVSDWDIAPDGSVWLRADSGLYVITPEAVATST